MTESKNNVERQQELSAFLHRCPCSHRSSVDLHARTLPTLKVTDYICSSLIASLDAFVALIAIPLVYWLFIRRGISGLALDRPVTTTVGDDTNSHPSNMPNIAVEVTKASSPSLTSHRSTAVLIVVDVQNDFISGSLKAHKAAKIIQPVNNAIRIAASRGMLIVFTRDWHPKEHWSFKENDGPYDTHCLMGEPGSQFPKELHVPPDSLVVNFGVNPGDVGYSALENASLAALVNNPNIDAVYVVGIALNYCVQSTSVSLAVGG